MWNEGSQRLTFLTAKDVILITCKKLEFQNVKTFESLSNGKDLGREKKYTNTQQGKRVDSDYSWI